jgi:hydrogenase maturation protease
MRSAVSQTPNVVEQIADAVLYEGYILYPYRPSAVKNQQRWNFGVLSPAAYAEAQRGSENSSMQTECLVHSNTQPLCDIKVRFLHLILRQAYGVANCSRLLSECGHLCIDAAPEHFEPVPRLNCNGGQIHTWQEAVEREVEIDNVPLNETQQQTPFRYPAVTTNDLLFDNSSGQLVGLLRRRQESIRGLIEIGTKQDGKLQKLTVRIQNETSLENPVALSRDEALLRSFVSTHTIMRVRDGEFVSLLDPPDFAREAAAACTNAGTYPVLAGDNGHRECILSSPIILYDYPQIASESAGDLCDGTEIDEILSLRIMTLTDQEKREIRDADDRARAILERTENLPAEQFLKMHGAMKRL